MSAASWTVLFQSLLCFRSYIFQKAKSRVRRQKCNIAEAQAQLSNLVCLKGYKLLSSTYEAAKKSVAQSHLCVISDIQRSHLIILYNPPPFMHMACE